MNPYIKSLGFTDIMSDSEEKTPTISPDQGATGETATSSKTKVKQVEVTNWEDSEKSFSMYLSPHPQYTVDNTSNKRRHKDLRTEEEECYNLNQPTYKPEEETKKQRGQDPRQITMTRRSYIADVLSQIEDAQSTPIDDEFQQYLSQNWNDDPECALLFADSEDGPEFAGFFAEDYTEAYRETLRVGYNIYYQEEIADGSVNSYDAELKRRAQLKISVWDDMILVETMFL